jgi:hypothetical protein
METFIRDIILDHMENIDILKICANGVDMLLDVSFKNFECIWSGPGDLVTFNFSRCFCIISGLNSIVDNFYVTPLHKKGPKNLVENYRPISLTSIVCKTMEKFIRDIILDHMEKHKLFTIPHMP